MYFLYTLTLNSFTHKLKIMKANGAASEIRTRTICLEGRYTSHYTNAAL